MEHSLTQHVAPFAGAWIEMHETITRRNKNMVAPFAGAWIEMTQYQSMLKKSMSLRSPERGLKSVISLTDIKDADSRSVRRSVD